MVIISPKAPQSLEETKGGVFANILKTLGRVPKDPSWGKRGDYKTLFNGFLVLKPQEVPPKRQIKGKRGV